MEGKFQTSFIPKKTVSSQPGPGPGIAKPVRTTNFFNLIITIIFVTILILTGIVYGYQYYLKKEVTKVEDELTQKLDTLRRENVIELARFDSRLTSAKNLMAQHVAVTEFFTFLSKVTSQSVRFTTFRYSVADQKLTLSMSGEARGFAVLADQADEFAKTETQEYIKGATISNYTLDKSGNVNFSFNATVDPSKILYKDTVETEEVATEDMVEVINP
jgi:hypothetical protein